MANNGSKTEKWDVIVAGGGPAGYTSAVFAARRGLSVLLLEKTRFSLTKLKISGKGRCNLTNNCTQNELADSIVRGDRFLRSALSGFGPADIMEFFENAGVPLKTERGRRVFPVSDRAADIAEALIRCADEAGVTVRQETVRSVITENGKVIGVKTGHGDIYCGSVILATGGLSYPRTGSDGDGYRIAGQAGHTVTECSPALVALRCAEPWIGNVEGLSLRNVSITCTRGKKTLYSEQGEMVFTDDGISGPISLSLSSYLAGVDYNEIKTWLDLKPALDEETLDRRVLRDFSEQANRDFKNSLGQLLPSSLIPVIVELSGIAPEKKVNQVSSQERRRLVSLLKHLPLTVCGTAGYDEAIVTAGGINTKEINPKTMESKIVPGLYFAGEIIDADGLTGGYNMTIAFSTGHAAGISVKKKENKTVRAVAIDGPGGAGKSTIAKVLAKEMGFIYVDTGALYRAIGLYTLRKGVDIHDNEGIIGLLPEIQVDIQYVGDEQHVFLNGEDVNGLIRTEEVSMAASAVSAVPEVRAFLLDTQRDLARRYSVVMDGRDIGTVILPDAECKIFLTASPEERARRRFVQLQEKGEEADYNEILEDLRKRDWDDSHREVAPLKRADDAILIDTTGYELEDSIIWVKRVVKEKLGLE